MLLIIWCAGYPGWNDTSDGMTFTVPGRHAIFPDSGYHCKLLSRADSAARITSLALYQRILRNDIGGRFRRVRLSLSMPKFQPPPVSDY